MYPGDFDPKERAVRLPFRLMLAALLVLMGVLFMYNGVKLILASDALALSCHPQRNHLSCELGRAILNLIPGAMRSQVLGLVGVIASVFAFAVAVLSFRKGRH
jgi:hypothetical protein